MQQIPGGTSPELKQFRYVQNGELHSISLYIHQLYSCINSKYNESHLQTERENGRKHDSDIFWYCMDSSGLMQHLVPSSHPKEFTPPGPGCLESVRLIRAVARHPWNRSSTNMIWYCKRENLQHSMCQFEPIGTSLLRNVSAKLFCCFCHAFPMQISLGSPGPTPISWIKEGFGAWSVWQGRVMISECQLISSKYHMLILNYLVCIYIYVCV